MLARGHADAGGGFLERGGDVFQALVGVAHDGQEGGEEQREDRGPGADAQDTQGDGQNGQGRDGVTNVEELHETLGFVDPVRSTQGNAGRDAHG
ncbi:hypothetical protein D3C76_954480 [compost metagenome]